MARTPASSRHTARPRIGLLGLVELLSKVDHVYFRVQYFSQGNGMKKNDLIHLIHFLHRWLKRASQNHGAG